MTSTKNNNKQYYSATRIAVAGFGKTGRALLDFILENKQFEALYLFNDTPIKVPADEVAKKEYENMGVVFLIGEEGFSRLQDVESVILSPGIDGSTERFQRLREKGISIVSEIEFASHFIKVPIIAVTGTNGKSTTASLIHHLLSKSGFLCVLAGNIGTPLIAEMGDVSNADVVVVEVSSFQLEEIHDFRPHIALVLNITPDHLDRYGNMENYTAAKLNIAKNQGPGDFLILNGDDPLIREQERTGAAGAARKVWFSRTQRIPEDLKPGACIDGRGGSGQGPSIRFTLDSIDENISFIKNPLRGVHNLENLLAAVTASRLMGAAVPRIEDGMEDFKGLHHRMEPVGTIGKVEFINDSKATNVDAALKSVNSIDSRLVLIMGGKDKDGDFTKLREVIIEKVHRVLLVGDAAPVILRQLNDIKEKFLFVTDFHDAVTRGYRILEETGGVVLLAPACASFDMFRNFEHRGTTFKVEVAALTEKIAERKARTKHPGSTHG